MQGHGGDTAARATLEAARGAWHEGCEAARAAFVGRGECMADQGHATIAPGAPLSSAEIAPSSPGSSVPMLMIAVFCAVLGLVLVIAVIDMLSPASTTPAGERAPSWPAP